MTTMTKRGSGQVDTDPAGIPVRRAPDSRRTAPTLIAIGGNSLLDPGLPPTVENQFSVTAQAVVPIASLIEAGEHLVLTHGNGPQVGFMKLRVELTRTQVHEVPLDSLVADSQGAIGYMIQRDLREELERRGIPAEIATIVTEVEVDPGDQAFTKPTKPIGRFYTAEEAERLHAELGWTMVDDAQRGWRRAVPSPRPRAVIQLETIRRLVDAGVTVIACGGGGIPVARGLDGRLRGLEAVVDKDLASALLAGGLGLARMIITTGVDAIYRDYLTARRTRIERIGSAELQRLSDSGQFQAGSMGPKVEAALQFLAAGGDEVVVCGSESLAEAFAGRAGTTIRKG